jgi:hypothetical protein
MLDFKQVEDRFKELKAQFEVGKLTETEFKSQLEDLMIQDNNGNWWMIGYETELWYRNDGNKWVQAEPPFVSPQKSTLSSDKWLAIFLITLAWTIGGGIGGAIYWEVGKYLGSAIAGAIAWGIGGLVTMFILYKDRLVSSWKGIGWVTLIWAISGAIGWTLGEVLTEASGAAIGAVVGGALGGAITLRKERALIYWKDMLWITLTWAVGMAIGWTISRIIQDEVDGVIGWPIGMAVSGAIGGFVLIWRTMKR